MEFYVFCENKGVFVLEFSGGRSGESLNLSCGKDSPAFGDLGFFLDEEIGGVVLA